MVLVRGGIFIVLATLVKVKSYAREFASPIQPIHPMKLCNFMQEVYPSLHLEMASRCLNAHRDHII